jgi:hypothetical protein
MYLTNTECKNIIEIVLKESVNLLNEQYELSQEFNLNDFNPNEKRIKKIKLLIVDLNKILEATQNYMKNISST